MYNRDKIFEQAKNLSIEENLFFIEDIVALLPCDKTTFYRFFEPESNEYNELKAILDRNKTSLKVSMRKKWKDAEAPALQMALMKLICTDSERKKLAMTHTDVTTNGKEVSNSIEIIIGEGPSLTNNENEIQ